MEEDRLLISVVLESVCVSTLARAHTPSNTIFKVLTTLFIKTVVYLIK